RPRASRPGSRIAPHETRRRAPTHAPHPPRKRKRATFGAMADRHHPTPEPAPARAPSKLFPSLLSERFPMSGMKFDPAPEVAEVAKPIIEKHHEHLLKHSVRIDYLFRDKEKKDGGMVVWGSAHKISSMAAFLAGKPAGADDEVLGTPFFV